MTSSNPIGDVLYGAFQARQEPPRYARVTQVPLDANLRPQGYVIADMDGNRVTIQTGPSDTFLPGDTLLAQRTGSKSGASYNSLGFVSGVRPDSGIVEVPADTTVGGITYGAGDQYLGALTGANWWFKYAQGVFVLRQATGMNGALGNLNGLYGYTGDTWGSAFGEYEANKINITTDPTNGFRIRNYTTPVFQADTSGVVWALSTFRAGTGDDMVGITATDGTWRLYAGNATPASAPFRVDKDGNLTATSVTISGAITPGPGSVIDGQYLTAKTVTANALTITAGGANLLTNSTFQIDTNADGTADNWDLYFPNANSVTMTVYYDGGVDNRAYQRISWAGTNTGFKGVYRAFAWKPNTTYCVTWWARASVATEQMPLRLNGAGTITYLSQPNLSVSWQQYIARVVFGATAGDMCILAISQGVTGNLDIDHVQIEEADTPSAWKPFPSELEPGSVTADKIYVTSLSALSANMGSLTAGSIVIGSSDKLWLNDSADGALNIGGSTKASAPFRVTAAGALTATNATIGGAISGATIDIGGADTTSFHVDISGNIWSGAAAYADGVFKVSSAGALVATSATVTGAINASSGTFTGLVQIGNSTPHLHLDGANGLIESSTFASGVSGWRIASDGSAEFENIIARGTIKTAVFAKSLVLAFAGSQVTAKSASTVATDCTLSGTTFTLVVKLQAGAAPFANGDLVYLKTETLATYATVNAGAASGANWSYTATYKSGSNSGTVVIGETVIDYGTDGGGRVYITADATDAPHILIDTHDMTATPVWTPRVRLGNLNGISGATGYGLWTDNGFFTGAITANSGSIAGFLTLGASGGIYQGTGTAASPTTGLKFWNDGGVGRIGGYNATVLQWGADTDGKLKVGAGDVTLDADGITFAQGTYDRNKLKFKTGSTLIGEFSVSLATNNTDGGAYAYPQNNSRTATMTLGTVHATGGNAKVVTQSTASSNSIGLVTKYAFINRGTTNTGNVFAIIDNMSAVQFAVSATGAITGASLRPTADSTTALQLQKADGTAVVTIDTTNSRVGFAGNIGVNTSPQAVYSLYVAKTNAAANGWVGLGFDVVQNAAGYIGYGMLGNATTEAATGTINGLFGLRGSALLNSTGDTVVAGTYGVYALSGISTDLASTTGVIYANYAGYFTTRIKSGGSIYANYGVYITGPDGGGYSANSYGIRVDAQKVSGVDAGWGVYQTGASDLNYFAGKTGIGTTAPATAQHTLLTDAGTNAVVNVATIGHDTSGTAANGFGAGINLTLQSSTTAAQSAARIVAVWNDATDATRKGDIVLYASDATTEREIMRGRGNGSGGSWGLFGTCVARPGAYTQTYNTATRTFAALTAATLTDSSGGTANTTIEAIGTTYSQSAVRNNFADLAAMVNKNTADHVVLAQIVTQLIDDLQAYGLLA